MALGRPIVCLTLEKTIRRAMTFNNCQAKAGQPGPPSHKTQRSGWEGQSLEPTRTGTRFSPFSRAASTTSSGHKERRRILSSMPLSGGSTGQSLPQPSYLHSHSRKMVQWAGGWVAQPARLAALLRRLCSNVSLRLEGQRRQVVSQEHFIPFGLVELQGPKFCANAHMPPLFLIPQH